SRSPLFQTKLILQNTPRSGLELKGVRLSAIGGETEQARLDLTVSMMDTGESLIGGVNYSRELFEGETIERLMGHYLNLLRAIAEEGGRPSRELMMLSDQERRRIVVGWNA